MLRVVDDVLVQRDQAGGSFFYAGDSVGGAVGLQLLLDVPARVDAAVLLCTGATIGTPTTWGDRVQKVRASGTPVMLTASASVWLVSGFAEREPDTASSLLHALQDTQDEGYLQVCGALAGFDVRDRLGEISAPVLAVAGAEDTAIPPAGPAEIATGTQRGRLVVLDGVAHVAPAEAPVEVAGLMREHLLGQPARPAPASRSSRYDAGLAVRREVLGDAHVDRATSATTSFTEDFQDSSPSTPGAASGPGPASTDAAAR